MTEYDTLLAARRLLATVEAGRAASLSLAAAYLPLRSAAALREQFQDHGAESSLWPEAAVERRLAIERLRRSPLRLARGDAPVADAVSYLISESFSEAGPSSARVLPSPPVAPIAAAVPAAASAPEPPAAEPAAAEPAAAEPAVVSAPEPAAAEPAAASAPEPAAASAPEPAAPEPASAEPAAASAPEPAAAEPVAASAPVPPPEPAVASAPVLDEFDLAPAEPGAEPAPLAGAVSSPLPAIGRNRRLVPDGMLAGLKRTSLPPVPAPVDEPTDQPASQPDAAPEQASPVDSAPAFVAPDIDPAAAPAPVAQAAHADAAPTPAPSGLAARLGALARHPGPAAPDAGSKPATKITDRRRDERIARRIALGNTDRRDQATGDHPPAEPADAAPLAAELTAAPDVDVEAAPAPPEAAEPATPAEPEAAKPVTAERPADSLRSLAASLGAVNRSVTPPTAPGVPSLAMTAAPTLAPRPQSVPPPPAPASDLEGPYITLETPVVRESAGHSTTATIEIRAAARIGSGGDETIALEGKDGPHDDVPDDDAAEGMRVHFEVASPVRSAAPPPEPGAGRLSFDDEDLTVVARADESPTDARPVVVDHAARRLTDDAALDQFLEAARNFRDRGEYPRAIQAFTDALDIRLSYADAYIGRGRCHMELGDYTSAVSDFRRAEDLQPKHPDPQVAMGDLYFARKEYKRAIEFYDQAVELDGAHAMARCRRGISHYYRKNFRQAFQDLQRANALDPEIPNIKKYVQMALKKMERGE